jgi:hypothetical protein
MTVRLTETEKAARAAARRDAKSAPTAAPKAAAKPSKPAAKPAAKATPAKPAAKPAAKSSKSTKAAPKPVAKLSTDSDDVPADAIECAKLIKITRDRRWRASRRGDTVLVDTMNERLSRLQGIRDFYAEDAQANA